MSISVHMLNRTQLEAEARRRGIVATEHYSLPALRVAIREKRGELKPLQKVR